MASFQGMAHTGTRGELPKVSRTRGTCTLETIDIIRLHTPLCDSAKIDRHTATPLTPLPKDAPSSSGELPSPNVVRVIPTSRRDVTLSSSIAAAA
ncbi:hypothetical protein J1614_000727 [Plenodomus biglobosus]|nr:hypothetical protein J1614_000727 [Plenodomus biglobosus]